MDKKNVIFNHTLEQYNKKYRNRRYRLLKYTKKQIEDFDKQYGHYVFNNKTYSLEFNHYLLKDRKWWFINDVYYEIPKPVRFTWFRNLNAGVQVATCLVGIGAVSSAVVFPTLAATVWKKGGDPVKPEPEPVLEEYVLPWWGSEGSDWFMQNSHIESKLDIKLGGSISITCNLSEAAGTSYTPLSNLNRFYIMHEDPTYAPTFEKIEVVVNDNKISNDNLTFKQLQPQNPGYDEVIISSSITNTFTSSTVIKFRCINCLWVEDSESRYFSFHNGNL